VIPVKSPGGLNTRSITRPLHAISFLLEVVHIFRAASVHKRMEIEAEMNATSRSSDPATSFAFLISAWPLLFFRDHTYAFFIFVLRESLFRVKKIWKERRKGGGEREK